MLDKEASANTYYYNYPPKADPTLKKASKDAGKTPQKKDKADSEAAKLKELYESQMDMLRKQYEG